MMSDLLRTQDKSTIHAGEHDAYWSLLPDDLFQRLDSSPQGLSSDQAQRRLKALGPANLKPRHQHSAVSLLLRQFKDPLVLILLFAVCVSVTVGEWVDAAVVTVVIAGTAILSFAQEYRATKAVEELMARVEAKATVLRDGSPLSIPTNQVVPGDVITLSAGNLIPGDGIILEAKACFADQAALTGETFPVEKTRDPVAADASLAERSNARVLSAGDSDRQPLKPLSQPFRERETVLDRLELLLSHGLLCSR